MQYNNTTTTPLAANTAFTASHTVNPEYPYLDIQLTVDQAGALYITEWEQVVGSGNNSIQVLTANLNAGTYSFHVELKGYQYTIRYQNGATNQASFSLAYQSSAISQLTPDRIMVLILRELRAQSMLLENLKAPTACQVNIPYGFDQITPQ